MKKGLRIEILLLVWGETYTALLNQLYLPSLLAPGNLPSWPYTKATRLVIYAPPADWETVEALPLLQQVRRIIKVEHRPFSPQELSRGEAPNKYRLMSLLHAHAVRRAQEQGASLILHMPDSVLANGHLSALARELAQPCNLIVALAPRISLEGFQAEVAPEPQSGLLVLSPAQCVDLLVAHMRPATFWTGSAFTHWPAQICYWQDAKTLTYRCFHLHPLFIRSPVPFRSQAATIDGSHLQLYLEQASPESIRVADERLLILSPTPAADAEGLEMASATLPARLILIDRFARENCSAIHRSFFNHPINLTSRQTQAPQRPEQDAVAFLSLRAVEVYWEVERLYLTEDYAGILAMYQEYGGVLREFLQIIYFFFGFYYIALAFYHLRRWDELREFLAECGGMLISFFNNQISFRQLRTPRVELEGDYGLVFLEQPFVTIQMANLLGDIPFHVYLDATRQADLQKTRDFYTLFSLPGTPLIVSRLDLAPETLAGWLAHAAAIAIPPGRQHQDFALWALVHDKSLLLLE